MSLKSAIQHNQGVFISVAICVIILGGFFACQLTETQRRQTIAAAADTAIAVTTGTPIPWQTIALVIGNLLGTGAVIDNRRKDVLVKILKKVNDANEAIISATLNPIRPDPPG